MRQKRPANPATASPSSTFATAGGSATERAPAGAAADPGASAGTDCGCGAGSGIDQSPKNTATGAATNKPVAASARP